MLGRDAGRENRLYETRRKAGFWTGAGPGHPATVKTPLYQCCIPEHLSQNGHRPCLILANCGRASVAAGVRRSLQWLVLRHGFLSWSQISWAGCIPGASTAASKVPWKDKGAQAWRNSFCGHLLQRLMFNLLSFSLPCGHASNDAVEGREWLHVDPTVLAGWAEQFRDYQPFPKCQLDYMAPCAGKASLCRETRDNFSASLTLAILIFFPFLPDPR